MRIAVPLVNGVLSMHFGHCDQFALIDVDPDAGTVLGKEVLDAPLHEPGLLPKWLSEHGAGLIIAGGMGMRAQQLFAQANIEVMVGAPGGSPETIVKAYLDETLETGENVCDH